MPRAKLKPCPFCGAKVGDGWSGLHQMLNGEWVVSHYCEGLRRPGGVVGVTIDVYGVTKKQAVEFWNTRAAIK